MTYPAGLWIKCWSATSKHLARAVAWSHSVPRAIARPGLLIALLFVVAPLCLLLSRSRLHAGGNTITVNTLEDPGSAAPACALRDAITAANTETAVNGCAAGTGNDTINFNVSGTITLSSTLPPIANTSPGSLTIDGSGQAITIDGADSYQVLSVNSGATLNLDNMTIAHGNAAWGGGIFNNGGNVNVADSTFSGNRAGGYGGGGVYSQGTLTVTNSTFLANIGDVGGGIVNVGGATITSSSFWGNRAPGNGAAGGGGILNQGTTTVTSSTFYGNTAVSGGAIFNNVGMLTVTNSTFSGNSATLTPGEYAYGGAIYNNLGTVTVLSSTISGNAACTSGGGIVDTVDGTTIINSILANNPGGNCVNTVTNGAYNISDDLTCEFGTSTGANGQTIGDGVGGGNLALDPAGPANNGGPTETVALEQGSYAIAAIPAADCPATDQRGAPRPAPGYSACDIGAYEYGGAVPSSTPTATATTAASWIRLSPTGSSPPARWSGDDLRSR